MKFLRSRSGILILFVISVAGLAIFLRVNKALQTKLLLDAEAKESELPVNSMEHRRRDRHNPLLNTDFEWFDEVTDHMGLDFVHESGPADTYFLPRHIGSGCACFQDVGEQTRYLYFLQAAGPGTNVVNRLYRQVEGGKFQDVTAGSGLDIDGYNIGVAVGDVNNDGLPDIVVTQYLGVRLFLNLGHGRFEDVTKDSGLANLDLGVSAAFFDYNRDGLLDLVLVNYVKFDPKKECPSGSPQGFDFCGPQFFPGTPSKLFKNLGSLPSDGGKPTLKVRFEDVSAFAGIADAPAPGYGVVCADFNGDGWPDFFVSNDGKPNHLWINQTNGKFVNEAARRGVALDARGMAGAGMGIAIGDADNNGLLDLYVTHLYAETNPLWKQESTGMFQDSSLGHIDSKKQRRGTGFGTLMADFNNDGFLDISLVNGAVARRHKFPLRPVDVDIGFWTDYTQRNQLFVNEGAGSFREISRDNPGFCEVWNVGRGMIAVDFNDDGAVDLVTTSIGDRARLFRNISNPRGHWLKVRAIDPKLKRDAYGAEVRVRAGDKEWLRLVNPAESFLSSSSVIAHFGMGPADHYDAIRVLWPDGTTEVFEGGPADQSIVLSKGNGRKP